MGGVIQVEPGGEIYIPYAKKKLRELHDYMLGAGLGAFNKRIDVSDGSAIYLKSLHVGNGVFADKIRITAVSALARVLYASVFGGNRSTDSDLLNGAAKANADGSGATLVGPTLITDVKHTEWSKDLSTFVAVGEHAAVVPSSLTQVGGVATLTIVAHGFADRPSRCITITGATVGGIAGTISEYNGIFEFTIATDDTITFSVDSGAASPATGTIYAQLGGEAEIVRGAERLVVPDVVIFTDDRPMPAVSSVSRDIYKRSGVGMTPNGREVFLRSTNDVDLFVHAVWNSETAVFDLTRVAPPDEVVAFATGDQTGGWYYTVDNNIALGRRSWVTIPVNYHALPAIEAGFHSPRPRLWVNPYKGNEVFAEISLWRAEGFSTAQSVGTPVASLFKVTGNYERALARYAKDVDTDEWGWVVLSSDQGAAFAYMLDSVATVSDVQWYVWPSDQTGLGPQSDGVYSTAYSQTRTYIGFEPGGDGFVVTVPVFANVPPVLDSAIGPVTIQASGGSPSMIIGTDYSSEYVYAGAALTVLDVYRDGAEWLSDIDIGTGGLAYFFIEAFGKDGRVLLQRRDATGFTLQMRWYYGGDFVEFLMPNDLSNMARFMSVNGDRLYLRDAADGVRMYKDGVLAWEPSAVEDNPIYYIWRPAYSDNAVLEIRRADGEYEDIRVSQAPDTSDWGSVLVAAVPSVLTAGGSANTVPYAQLLIDADAWFWANMGMSLEDGLVVIGLSEAEAIAILVDAGLIGDAVPGTEITLQGAFLRNEFVP